MLCHLLSFCSSVAPPGHILGRLILWILKQDESAFVDEKGKECLNFQISITLRGLPCLPLLLVVSGFFLVIAPGKPEQP